MALADNMTRGAIRPFHAAARSTLLLTKKQTISQFQFLSFFKIHMEILKSIVYLKIFM
jgi:hypothetical protein